MMFATLIVNPDYKSSTPEQKKAHEAAKAAGPLKDLPYGVAVDNVKLSDGLYIFEPKAAEAKTGPRDLEEFDNDELKLMFVSMGGQTEKQMKRGEIIKWIRLKLSEVEISDDA